MARSAEERFWAKVQIGEGDECWLWTAACLPNGYGYFHPTHGTNAYAHRFSWEITNGQIPSGKVLDHLCRVRNCVNPSHLEPVTMRENLRRGEGFAGVNARKTECPKGHEYTDENTYVYKWRGRVMRYCRTCQKERRVCATA